MLLAAARGAHWAVYPISAVLLVAFIVGMLAADRLSAAGRAVWIGFLMLGAVVLMSLSPDFLWIAFPLWMAAGAVLPLIFALLLTAVTLAVIVTVLTMSGGETVGAVLGPLVGALVALGLSRGVLMFEHEATEHRRLLGEVLRAEEATASAQRQAGVLAERARLAQDIHDTLAQGFSSVVLLARIGQRNPEQAARLLDEIEATASSNLADARRVVYALAPRDSDGLAEPLRRIVDEAAAAMGAEATITVDPELPRLATSVEVALIRAAQGLVGNVRDHSGAGRFAVEVARAEDQVRLDVVDNGAGFDPGALRSPGPAGGYGLQGLRDRLIQLGGGLSIESEPGGGTAVSVHLPLRLSEEER